MQIIAHISPSLKIKDSPHKPGLLILGQLPFDPFTPLHKDNLLKHLPCIRHIPVGIGKFLQFGHQIPTAPFSNPVGQHLFFHKGIVHKRLLYVFPVKKSVQLHPLFFSVSSIKKMRIASIELIKL